MMELRFTLDLSKNTALKYLDCSGNIDKLLKLDVSNNVELVELYCQYNSIKTLDLSNNTALRVLNCEDNQNVIFFYYFCGNLIPLRE
jgi:Leucine-rich repeat (LRR) protein